jgi:hypothetical protein
MASTLFQAVRIGDLKRVVKLLRDGADVDERTDEEQTALLLAARRGHREIVRVLLENGADINAADENGNTALILATKARHKNVVRTLLSKKVDVEAADNQGRVALHHAAKLGDVRLLRMLVLAGANIDATDDDGNTALMLAEAAGHDAAIEYLEEVEAEGSDEDDDDDDSGSIMTEEATLRDEGEAWSDDGRDAKFEPEKKPRAAPAAAAAAAAPPSEKAAEPPRQQPTSHTAKPPVAVAVAQNSWDSYPERLKNAGCNQTRLDSPLVDFPADKTPKGRVLAWKQGFGMFSRPFKIGVDGIRDMTFSPTGQELVVARGDVVDSTICAAAPSPRRSRVI